MVNLATDFEQSGFDKMMQDVRSSRINCIIVKDLSRLGGNYVETGNYIERVFPFFEVLFIAVTDGYDSEQREAGLAVCKSNIFNKYYSRNLGKNQGSSPEQFPWHCPDYCTEKRGENRYLAEAPKTYSVSYDANNSPTGSSMMCSDPNLYTSEEAVTIMDRETPFPLMGNIVKFGYNFVRWNMEPDGTGTDYAPGRRQALRETFTSMQSGRRKAVSSVYLK